MKRIPLTKGYEAIVDDDSDLGVHSWYATICNGKVYAARDIAGKRIYMHRFLLPIAGHVDHINGDSLDNRIVNLRGATHTQNIQNQKQ